MDYQVMKERIEARYQRDLEDLDRARDLIQRVGGEEKAPAKEKKPVQKRGKRGGVLEAVRKALPGMQGAFTVENVVHETGEKKPSVIAAVKKLVSAGELTQVNKGGKGRPGLFAKKVPVENGEAVEV